jgi:hypothetical protein
MAAQERTSHGWAVFVAVYLLIAGTLNLIWGIAALENKYYFTSEGLLWSSLNTWGWVAIVVGALQLMGSAFVAARMAFGAVLAVFLAFCGIIFNFLSIGAYPVWSAVLLLIDGLVIWGVTVHSEQFVKE